VAVALAAGPAVAKPSKSFSVSAAERPEADGTIPVTVTRSVKSGAASVHIATSDGSATSGDYTAVSQTVSFRGGRNSAVVNIPLTDDSVAEPDENLTVTLSSPSAGYGISSSSAQVTIDNDDPPAAPTNVDATTFSGSRIDLSWDPATDYVTDWDIYRSTISGAEEFVGNTTTNSYSDTGLDSETTYYYFVMSHNGIGGGTPQSAEVSATTFPASCTSVLDGPVTRTC
jgi:hypothetical protein